MSVDGGLYGYSVSNAACYVAIVVYAILSIHHTWILFRHRCWYWIPFLVGGYMEVAGYIVRRISGDDDTSMPLFAVQFLFVLLPPILFAASIYMTLGRLLRYIGATQLSPIPIKWVTPTFVTGDIISLALVGAGGGIQATSPDDQDALDTGKPIMMTGLGIQVLFFSIFIIEVATCHVRLNGRNWQAHSPGKFSWPWLFMSLYAGCILIFIRSVFRLVEYGQGWDGYIIDHEIFMYFFDTLLMTLCMLCYSIIHPAYVISRSPLNHTPNNDQLDLEKNRVSLAN